MLLSKSSYIKFLQCHKYLWLHKHRQEWADPLPVSRRLVFNRGHAVGHLARRLFPGGVDAGWSSPAEYRKYVQMTQYHLLMKTPVIYEAAFLAGGVLIAVDILVKTETGYYAYEVKSSLSVSPTYLNDAALQYYVLKKSGLPIRAMHIVTLNRHYIYEGGEYDLQRLFTIRDVTEEVEAAQAEVAGSIERAKDVLELPDEPARRMGLHCISPYDCDFEGHCSALNNQSTLRDLGIIKKEHWLELLENGVQTIADARAARPAWISEELEEYARTGSTAMTRAANPGLDKLTENLQNPDFSFCRITIATARPALPVFAGTRPYQQIAYMIHITDGADKSIECVPDFEKLNIAGEWTSYLAGMLSGYEAIICFGQRSALLEWLPAEYERRVYDMAYYFRPPLTFFRGGLPIPEDVFEARNYLTGKASKPRAFANSFAAGQQWASDKAEGRFNIDPAQIEFWSEAHAALLELVKAVAAYK